MWGHDVVEPSLNAASVLDLQTIGGGRGDIVGARGLKLVTDASGGAGGHRPHHDPEAATRCRRRARSRRWWASTWRRTSKQREGRGRAGVRRGDRLPRRRGAAGGGARRRRPSRAPSLLPTRSRSRPRATFAAPRSSGRRSGHRRDDRGGPRATRPVTGGPVGPAGALRRAAARDARPPWSRRCGSDGQERADLFRVAGGRRRAAEAHPRPRPADRRPSRCSPTSARRARWSRSGPATARSWPRPTGRATTARTSPPSGSSRRARRSRSSAAWPCSAPG